MKPSIRAWIKRVVRSLIFAATTCGFCHAQPVKGAQNPNVISADRFRLLIDGERFFLQLTSGAKTQPLAIPRDWLIAPEEEKEEEEEELVLSSFRFDHHVTSFPIGNGEIGIQLSSYDMMKEGSMQAAVGRDVFLIYDPTTSKLRPGRMNLGITKERSFGEGCWHARMVHFIVADVNQDGRADIGTINEEIRCPEGRQLWEGDSYEQHPLHWYLYTADGWKLEEDDSGWPDSYAELPLIGIEISPVDFVGQILWRSADPFSWKSPPRYLPTYRKRLIAEERQRKSKPQLKRERK